MARGREAQTGAGGHSSFRHTSTSPPSLPPAKNATQPRQHDNLCPSVKAFMPSPPGSPFEPICQEISVEVQLNRERWKGPNYSPQLQQEQRNGNHHPGHQCSPHNAASAAVSWAWNTSHNPPTRNVIGIPSPTSFLVRPLEPSPEDRYAYKPPSGVVVQTSSGQVIEFWKGVHVPESMFDITELVSD